MSRFFALEPNLGKQALITEWFSKRYSLEDGELSVAATLRDAMIHWNPPYDYLFIGPEAEDIPEFLFNVRRDFAKGAPPIYILGDTSEQMQSIPWKTRYNQIDSMLESFDPGIRPSLHVYTYRYIFT